MIIIRICGGLGNQLFQYAMGRGVSSKLKTDLYLTWVPWEKDPWEYSLDYFHTKGSKAKNSAMLGFVGMRKKQKMFDKLYGYAKYLRINKIILPFYYVENGLTFHPEVFSKNRNYFWGYWQTEKYFKHIEDEIRKEISLIKPLSSYSRDVMNEICKKNAVSLHVRRGDYITRPSANIFHGVCSPEYYKTAVDFISKKVPDPHFFLFSDDYEWTKENFKWLPFPFTCVKNPSEKNYEDLMLMAACRHHIIANSTFSWWGAWLNPRKDKIVIAPKKWFANAPKNNAQDLLPEEWLKM